MNWMKRLAKYCVIFVICYFVVNLLTFNIVKSSYKTKKVDVNFEQPKIEIYESKSTITNGYIKGKITNNTNETIINKLLKLNFISPRGVQMGIKYVDIGTLLSGESKDFMSQFNFDNVDNISISYVDKKDVANINELDFGLDNLADNKTNWKLILFGVFIFFGKDIIVLL